MHQIKKFLILWLLLPTVLFAGNTPDDNPLAQLDSMLSAYQQASAAKKLSQAQSIIDYCLQDDQLVGNLSDQLKHAKGDSLDFHVWFATERYYLLNSYFKEALDYIERALPLAVNNSPFIHATLLCDQGYALFKQARNVEATESVLEAEKISKRHKLYMPLARAYNYQAIINISLGYTEEAKHFVERAIETDRLTGSHDNTHNYLGIACEVYTVANEPEPAIRYGIQAVEAAREIGYPEAVVNHLSQLSYAYNRNGEMEKALQMSMEAVQTVEQMPVIDRNLLAISLEYVTYDLLDMKRNEEAIPFIRRALKLQQEVGNTRSVCYDHKSLAEALEPNHPREAFQELRLYSSMMDSLHYAEMHDKLSQSNAQLHNDELKEENIRSKERIRNIIWASVIGALLLMAVITALAYINRLRRKTQLATQRLQATREAFFTNVTHEFRTPLTVIMGTARQVQEQLDKGRVENTALRKGMDAIDRNSEELLSLVSQLLDVAKVKSAIGEAEWRRTDIVPLLTMLTERMKPWADSRNLALTYLTDEHEIVMDTVPGYLQKVVVNLLSNALKQTPEGGHVEMQTRLNDNKLVLTVSDDGPGISPDDIPHIFEPFYQGQHSKLGQGTGIGLSFVREIVEASHGSVAAENKPDGGALFTVTLPLRQQGVNAIEGHAEIASDLLIPSPQVSSADTSGQSVSDKEIRILVVEDNRDVARYIGSLLSPSFEVCYAEDGEQGIKKAKELVPDLIITDLMMPHTDGLELCRAVRNDELTCHIPLIVVTAKVTDEDRVKAFEAGATAYLNKPFNADELTLLVKNQFEMSRLILRHTKLQLLENQLTETDDESAHAESAYERMICQGNDRFLSKLTDVVHSLMQKGEISTMDVANTLCMSRSQLTRKLKAAVNESPAALILSIRLKEASRLLLLDPPLPVSEVAFRCGFTDQAHFSRVFRQHFGIAPSQFSKQR